METRELTCIRCPIGCHITVEMENGEVRSVTGNSCPRGEEYASNEVTHPVRTGHMPDTLTVRFRVGNEYRNTNLAVYLDGKQLMKLPKRIMAPGEMEQIILVKSKVSEIISGSEGKEHELIIRVEDKE